MYKSSYKTSIKKLALNIINKVETETSLNSAYKAIDKAVAKGVLNKNAAARKKSKLALAAAKAV